MLLWASIACPPAPRERHGAALAGALGLSAFHFHRVFKTATGLTPKAYADAHRSDRLREALPSSKTITGAIYDAGFNSNGRFYAKSAEELGMTPRPCFAARRAGDGS